MYIYYIINFFLLINTVIGFNANINLHSDLKKLSLLSKLIYDYDFVGKHPIKNNYIINEKINIKNTVFSGVIAKENTKNLTIDFIQKNNIYFNLLQFVTFLNNKDFLKNTEKYFETLNENFPNTQIYGYFYNKNRLHSLILINHKYKEIIVVFRGSQYIEEWIKNLFINEKKIIFNQNFTFHSGIYNMYTNDDIDKNIIYILENMFKYFPKYRKVFTGHSRGSTNCLLLVIELLTKFNNKFTYEIFNFGTPQILNYNLASFIHNNKNIKIFNIINEDDIITTFPLPNKYHIGTKILLKNNKIFLKKYNEPYKINFDITKIYKSILNHDLNTYIKNIYFR